MSALFAAYALLGAVHAPAAPLQLQRTYVVGQKSTYSVKAEVNVEFRQRGLDTFLPDDEEISYTFFTRVLSEDHGTAQVKYSRPTVTVTGAATPDADPKTEVEKTDYLLQYEMSSANQVLDAKDLAPKKKEDKPKSDELFAHFASKGRRQLEEIIGSFTSDMIRLAAYVSMPDGALDLEPPFALTPVKVGDTWSRTLGYQPQKLKSKTGKMAVQRLDLTYSYQGPMVSRGKQVIRIHADTSLDTDLATYVNGLFDATPENTGLKSIPNRLKIGLDFDLDPKTLQTIYAEANSKGGFEIYVTELKQPVEEVKVTGKTTMNLDSSTIVPPTPKRN